MTAKERLIHDKGLVAVLDAYGWHDLVGNCADEPIHLERLIALNAERRAEEVQGRIRWLRPGFQNPQAQASLVGAAAAAKVSSVGDIAAAATPTLTAPLPWPATLPEQMQAVAQRLADSPAPQSLDAIAARFSGKGKWKSRLPELLATLALLGRARRLDVGRWME